MGGCNSASRAGRPVIGRLLVQIPALSWAACRSVLEQVTEPQITPDVRLAPCMAASALSEGPSMSWRLVQVISCLRPVTAGIGSSKNPCYPIKRIKWLQTMDEWLCWYQWCLFRHVWVGQSEQTGYFWGGGGFLALKHKIILQKIMIILLVLIQKNVKHRKSFKIQIIKMNATFRQLYNC